MRKIWTAAKNAYVTAEVVVTWVSENFLNLILFMLSVLLMARNFPENFWLGFGVFAVSVVLYVIGRWGNYRNW